MRIDHLGTFLSLLLSYSMKHLYLVVALADTLYEWIYFWICLVHFLLLCNYNTGNEFGIIAFTQTRVLKGGLFLHTSSLTYTPSPLQMFTYILWAALTSPCAVHSEHCWLVVPPQGENGQHKQQLFAPLLLRFSEIYLVCVLICGNNQGNYRPCSCILSSLLLPLDKLFFF